MDLPTLPYEGNSDAHPPQAMVGMFGNARSLNVQSVEANVKGDVSNNTYHIHSEVAVIQASSMASSANSVGYLETSAISGPDPSLGSSLQPRRRGPHSKKRKDSPSSRTWLLGPIRAFINSLRGRGTLPLPTVQPSSPVLPTASTTDFDALPPQVPADGSNRNDLVVVCCSMVVLSMSFCLIFFKTPFPCEFQGDLSANILKRQTIPQVYVSCLLGSGRGFACWKPEPQGRLAGSRGVIAGDVGIISPDAGFVAIFNFWEDELAIRRTAERICYHQSYQAPVRSVRIKENELREGDAVVQGTSRKTRFDGR